MAVDHQALLILPRLRIQNANAISSPLTWGFPAPSAFTGFMHALQRRLSGDIDITFGGIGMICHRFEPQVTDAGYTRAFRLTRNPVAKDGSTAAIVEEGRAHMDVTLILGASGEACLTEEAEREATARYIADVVAGMRIAGGSLIPGPIYQRPKLAVLPEDTESRDRTFRRWYRQWLPGFALVGRDDLLDTHLDALRTDNTNATRLDAWLDMSRLNQFPVAESIESPDEDDGRDKQKATWQTQARPGWIVPIPVGYAALSDTHPPDSVAGARDETTPFRFVESLFSLGQWISPHRLDMIEQLLWYHDADPENGLYLCRNDFADLH